MAHRVRAVFAFLAFVVLFTGCSSAALSEPVIESVNFPATATKDASGNFAMTGTVAAYESGGTVAKLIVRVPTQHGVTFADSSIDVSGRASPYTILLAFPGTIPVGTYTFQVFGVDTNGRQGLPYGSSVALQ